MGTVRLPPLLFLPEQITLDDAVDEDADVVNIDLFLTNIIVCAKLHRFHRYAFGTCGGHHDDRRVKFLFVHPLKNVQP